MDSGPLMLNGNCGVSHKIIIDTDPGIDDSMAIMMAFQTPNLEILGLTTTYGNVSVENATRNALLLCEMAGRPGVLVAQGNSGPLKGGEPTIGDFAHGSDGLVEKVSQYPGEISILALGPLTNLAMAIKRDSSFVTKVKRVVILGGSFFALETSIQLQKQMYNLFLFFFLSEKHANRLVG
ncbi:putative uridine nucleosidase [Helianthus annuus]|nr:putative uridine nucleosidase [Helianthus annuus]